MPLQVKQRLAKNLVKALHNPRFLGSVVEETVLTLSLPRDDVDYISDYIVGLITKYSNYEVTSDDIEMIDIILGND